MAPPRRILRQQLEILMDFLEENKDMSKGLPPGATLAHHSTRQKWALLAKRLNAVQGGDMKTPDGWKKYWFAWRHKCRRKGADARRFQANPSEMIKRFVPLNDLEVRVLELSGKGSVTPTPCTSKQLDSFLAEDSDSEPLENVKSRTIAGANMIKSFKMPNTAVTTETHDSRSGTPPPKWALELEERRIAAEERSAEALETMAEMMRSQEERRSMLDERIADALSVIAGTLQDLSSSLHEAMRQHNPSHANGPDVKDVFL